MYSCNFDFPEICLHPSYISRSPFLRSFCLNYPQAASCHISNVLSSTPSRSLVLCFHSPACCTDKSNPLWSTTNPLTSPLFPLNNTHLFLDINVLHYSEDQGCWVPLKRNYIPIYTASYPTKTAILRPDILPHTLLVTLGKDQSLQLLHYCPYPSLKIKHIFKNFLKWVIKRCACDAKYGHHQHLRAFYPIFMYRCICKCNTLTSR